MSIEKWLDIRKRAGKEIDPNNAEACSQYVQIFDPYGVCGEVPGPANAFVREWFVRAPESDIWVWFEDLPSKTQKALDKRWAEEAKKAEDPDDEDKFFEI